MSARNTETAGRSPFLLEIGSEELPARFQPPAREFLARRFAELLDELDLAHGEVTAFAAPRRLAVRCDALAVRQPDREVEVTGPPVAAAFDAEGRPTRAAEGFARKHGATVGDCHRIEDARGTYLAVRRTDVGRGAPEVLGEALPGLILGIPFPKVMRWGDGDVEYARPLQWLVALLGDDEIPFSVGGLTAGRISRGHRTLDGDARFAIPGPDAYVETLREHGVIVDQAERERLVVAGAAAVLAALPAGAEWRRDEDLLVEVVHLCEHPTVFAGSFEERFFELPDEVIVTALKAHQRYFAVARREGGLLPHFLAVRDGGAEALDDVRRGNERVLRARLADALFYWEFDQRRPPSEQAERLGDVTWLEGFGSILDKTRRLEALMPVLWDGGLGDGGALPETALRAARLSKFDLVSEMIRDGKEFTKLEGTIGAHYARRAGEPEEVCRAIAGHYLPRGAGDDLPDGRTATLLAVADRLDTVAGCWLAGFAPTGAKDPYALRRQVRAVLRIAVEGGFRISLRNLFARALEPLAGYAPEREQDTVLAEILEFAAARLERFLVEDRGRDLDVVRAVLPAHGDDPTDALAWSEALTGYRNQDDFLLLATGFKRCRNILEGDLLDARDRESCLGRWREGGRSAAGDSFAGLTEPAEADLRDQIVAAVAELESAEGRGDYAGVFRRLAAFGPAIDRYFDTVRVNVPDEAVRRLRHAFLREVDGLFARYAEFSTLAPQDT